MCEKERRTMKGNLVVGCTLQLLLTWQGYKMSVHLMDMLNKVQNVFSIGFLKSEKDDGEDYIRHRGRKSSCVAELLFQLV